MKDDEKYGPSEATAGDHAHTLVRAGIASIPVVGFAATELFQKRITPPLEKRRQQWMESVAEGLQQLESQQFLSIEQLADNDVFIDVVLAASHAVIRTRQEKKREALENFMLNAASLNPLDESRQQAFIGLVNYSQFGVSKSFGSFQIQQKHLKSSRRLHRNTRLAGVFRNYRQQSTPNLQTNWSCTT